MGELNWSHVLCLLAGVFCGVVWMYRRCMGVFSDLIRQYEWKKIHADEEQPSE